MGKHSSNMHAMIRLLMLASLLATLSLASIDQAANQIVPEVEEIDSTDLDTSSGSGVYDFDASGSGDTSSGSGSGVSPTPTPTPTPTPSSGSGADTDGYDTTPTPTPTPTSSETCQDYTCSDGSEWSDEDGSEYDCDWYQQNTANCDAYGDGFENCGYNANEACCACGGGTTGDDDDGSGSGSGSGEISDAELPLAIKTATPKFHETMAYRDSQGKDILLQQADDHTPSKAQTW